MHPCIHARTCVICSCVCIVCMCVYNIYIFTYTYMSLYVCISVYMYVFPCMCVYTSYIHIYMICVYFRMSTFMLLTHSWPHRPIMSYVHLYLDYQVRGMAPATIFAIDQTYLGFTVPRSYPSSDVGLSEGYLTYCTPEFLRIPLIERLLYRCV